MSYQKELERVEGMLIFGWKAILKHTEGIKDKRTLKRYAEEWSLPIMYLGRRPTIVDGILDRWWVNVREICDKRKEKLEKEEREEEEKEKPES